MLTQGYALLLLLLPILERKGEKEKNIDGREKYQLVASQMHPNQGSNLQPRYVP